MIFVIDIDGTLADNSHRAAKLQHYCIQCGAVGKEGDTCSCGSMDYNLTQESFDAFMDPALVLLDTPAPGAAAALESMRSFRDSHIIFLTGRRSETRVVTQQWLSQYMGWDPANEPLLMREPAQHGVPASAYKHGQASLLAEEYKDESLMFFEDDPHIFNVFREFGLVLRAPECWEHWNPRGSAEREPFFKA